MNYKKYKQGDKIFSLETVSQQKFIFYGNKLYHHSWFMNWQARALKSYIQNGHIRYALQIENDIDILSLYSQEEL